MADLIALHDGRILTVHDPEQCAGQACCIHHPSDHPLRDAPLHWRASGPLDIKPSHMERICPHGVGHPDPDGLRLDEVEMHGCDGCCRA